MRALRWVISILAILAVAGLPAILAEAPFTNARAWTVAQLAGEGLHLATAQQRQQPGQQARPSLRQTVQRAEALGRELGVKVSPNVKRAAALGALIPVAAVVAGICVALSFLWLALEWNWLYRLDALVGLLASIYAIVAGWWLTHAVQAAVVQMLAKMQHGVGGLLHKLGVRLPTAAHAVGIKPQVGLYVLGILFLAMLVLPRPQGRARR